MGDQYTLLIAELASYADWWERSTTAVEDAVDPDGMLAMWGGSPWLQEGALTIVGMVIGMLQPRQGRHRPDNPLGIPPVSPDIIARLDAAPCFPQRTPGWFMDRHTLISASVAWKAISSDAMFQALIREKLVMPSANMGDPAANPTSPLHWGQKYEPVATALYSQWFDVDVREYGCIRHPVHRFLGASPDGVVVSKGPMYGRMLEIKNVVNRELTGIPKRDYWIQMQMQMEACNLPLCDFLECQFVEYSSWAAADADGTFNQTADGKAKGPLLMLFDEEVERIRYFYPPLAIRTMPEYTDWERRTREANPGMSWMQRIWWRLESYSLVTVERNSTWFEAVLPRFADAWEAIEDARAEAKAVELQEAAGGDVVDSGKTARKGLDFGGPKSGHVGSANSSVTRNHDRNRADARRETRWPVGTCIIQQDSEEDEDSCDEPGP